MEALASKILKNTLSTVGLRIITLLMGFVLVPILVDAVGADGYGLILLAFTITGYFVLLSAGVPSGTVKFVAQFHAAEDEHSLHRTIDTSLLFFVGVGIVVATGLAVFVQLGGAGLFEVSPDQTDAMNAVLWVAAAMSLIAWPANALDATMEGLQEHHRRNIISGVTRLLGQLLGIAAALADLGIVAVFVGMQLGGVLRAIWLAVAVKRLVPGWRISPRSLDKAIFKLLMGFSAWVLLGQIGNILAYRLDHVVLGAVVGVAAVTLYDITMRPYHLVRELSGLMMTAIMPAVSAVQETEGREGLERLTWDAARYHNLLLAPLSLGTALFAEPLLRVWMGPEYAVHAWIAQLACVWQLVYQAQAPMVRVLMGAGHVKHLTLIGLFCAVVNAGLSVWWVYEWGVIGVIAATLAGMALGTPLQYFVAWPRIGLPKMAYLKAVWRGQAPHLVTGVLVVALWVPVQKIDSWLLLLPAGAVVGAAFLAVVWYSLEPSARAFLTRKLRRRAKPA